MKNILLIGLGRFGKHVAYQLNELGHEVMAVDANENLVNEILPYVTDAQIGDSTNENFLESLGIKNYDCFGRIVHCTKICRIKSCCSKSYRLKKRSQYSFSHRKSGEITQKEKKSW
jgi:3-hydroxyacyl-CoA dehydrogenase